MSLQKAKKEKEASESEHEESSDDEPMSDAEASSESEEEVVPEKKERKEEKKKKAPTPKAAPKPAAATPKSAPAEKKKKKEEEAAAAEDPVSKISPAQLKTDLEAMLSKKSDQELTEMTAKIILNALKEQYGFEVRSRKAEVKEMAQVYIEGRLGGGEAAAADA